MVAISVTFTLVLLEVGTRRFMPLWPDHLSDFDPHFGFARIPDAAGWWVSIINPLEFRTWVTINSHGLRDREVAIEKPDGTVRVLVLGDSMVDGLEVPLEAIFTKQLEQRLRRSGYQVEVINGGHYGYSTDQELLFYRHRGQSFKPDIVMLAVLAANDIRDNLSAHTLGPKPFFKLTPDGSLTLHNFPVPKPVDHEAISSPVDWLKRLLYSNSKLYRFSAYQIRQRLLPTTRRLLVRLALLDEKSIPSSVQQGDPGIYGSKVSNQLEQGWRLTQSIIQKLRMEVEAAGSTFVLVIMPDRKQFLLPRNDARWNITLWNDRLNQFCAQQDLNCLDLYPVFRQRLKDGDINPLFYRYDIHPTTRGHSLIADTLEHYLQQTGMLSSKSNHVSKELF